MITREQFEAHVREQANARHILTADLTGLEYARRLSARNTEISTRMEHEWPLLEVLQDLHDTAIDARALIAGQQAPIDRRALIVLLTDRLSEARAILTPYTTKPTEQR